MKHTIKITLPELIEQTTQLTASNQVESEPVKVD